MRQAKSKLATDKPSKLGKYDQWWVTCTKCKSEDFLIRGIPQDTNKPIFVLVCNKCYHHDKVILTRKH